MCRNRFTNTNVLYSPSYVLQWTNDFVGMGGGGGGGYVIVYGQSMGCWRGMCSLLCRCQSMFKVHFLWYVVSSCACSVCLTFVWCLWCLVISLVSKVRRDGASGICWCPQLGGRCLGSCCGRIVPWCLWCLWFLVVSAVRGDHAHGAYNTCGFCYFSCLVVSTISGAVCCG